jgi:hypothetical protein
LLAVAAPNPPAIFGGESSLTLVDLTRSICDPYGWRISAISHLIRNQMRGRITGLPRAGLQWFLAGKKQPQLNR